MTASEKMVEALRNLIDYATMCIKTYGSEGKEPFLICDAVEALADYDNRPTVEVDRERLEEGYIYRDCSQGCPLQCDGNIAEIIDSGECYRKQLAYLQRREGE